MKERGGIPNIPPYDHDRKSYYVIDKELGLIFRPLDISDRRLVALNAPLVRKREHFRSNVALFPQGEPSKIEGQHRRGKQLTRIA